MKSEQRKMANNTGFGEQSRGNDCDNRVKNTTNLYFGKVSGGGKDKVFIGSEYLIWADETSHRQAA
jgi:hypothetical protein